jgi:tetratricopeptide (TPR) repeat protein
VGRLHEDPAVVVVFADAFLRSFAETILEQGILPGAAVFPMVLRALLRTIGEQTPTFPRMTANKQTSRAASFSALALISFLACTCLSSLDPRPALAKNDLPANTAESYRHHAVELLFKHKDDPAGFDFYEKAVELASKDYGANSSYLGDLYFELASAEKEAGHFKQAEQNFEASLRCKPNSVSTRLQLAALYKKEKRATDLCNQIQLIKAKDPGSAQVQQSLYFQDNNRPDKAAQSALLVHQIGTAKVLAIASAKSAGWLNPFSTPAPATTKSAPAPQHEQTASAALKLTAPEASQPSQPIVTPVETRVPPTNENPTAINKENSISPLGVFSKILAPRAKPPDKVDTAAKIQKEQAAEKERNRLRLERDRQRDDLARRQAAQAQRAATRRGAAPKVAVVKPVESKSSGPALKTSAKKINGKAAEGKAVEAQAAVEAKPNEAKPATPKVVETKPPVEAAPPKETTQEAAVPVETPAPPPPKKRPNPFNKVGIFGKAGDTEKAPDSNSENQVKAKPKPPPPSSNIQRAMESVPMQPPMPVQEAPQPKHLGKPKPGLVPPPPPVMALPGMMNPNPYYGGYPPAGAFMQPPPQQVQQPRAKPKPVVKKEAPPPEDEPAAAPTPASAKNGGDDEFLIEWGGGKQKKKKSKPLD